MTANREGPDAFLMRTGPAVHLGVITSWLPALFAISLGNQRHCTPNSNWQVGWGFPPANHPRGFTFILALFEQVSNSLKFFSKSRGMTMSEFPNLWHMLIQLHFLALEDRRLVTWGGCCLCLVAFGQAARLEEERRLREAAEHGRRGLAPLKTQWPASLLSWAWFAN